MAQLGALVNLLPAPLVGQLNEYLQPLLNLAELYVVPQLCQAATKVDEIFKDWRPCYVLLVAFAITTALWRIHFWWQCVQEDGGLVAYTFASLRRLSFVAKLVEKEKCKIRSDLLDKRQQPSAAEHGSAVVLPTPHQQLPPSGITAEQLLSELRQKTSGDHEVPFGSSTVSGAVYVGSAAHQELVNAAYAAFATTNPLHSDVWPSVRQMEAEVVAMTAAMLGGGPEVCGSMTSGGTESILLAMKASRDYAKAVRGVRRPEIIIAPSAHAAYFKAAEYFKMKLVVAPLGADYRLSGDAVRRKLTRNTAVVVASAPGFPHGLVDHVQDIAKVCARAGVCLHVDGCLGGFVLPFARKLGREIPPFDFSVPGVTSMSVDTHKFGLAAKGSSVVLYSSPRIRQHQYTGITDWTGGLYISPTMAGSRPGGLIAAAWVALLAMGQDGYERTTQKILEVSDRFQAGLRDIPDLRVIGRPVMTVVAFGAAPGSKVNMYKINDLMTKRGWHLNALMSPPALHFCFTSAHTGTGLVESLLKDLAECTAVVRDNPDAVKGGSAPMYGMAAAMPDRGMVAEFLCAYQDVQLTV